MTRGFKGLREEQASGLALRCFISPLGRVRQFGLGYPYGQQDPRFGVLADTISGITRSFCQRVINPAGS